MEAVTLYLDGSVLKDETGNFYCGETQTVLLLATYCGNVATNAVIVSDMHAIKTDCCADKGIKIQESPFMNVSHIAPEDLPLKLKDCRLPAVMSIDQVNIYSGVCTVLRYLIKRASEQSNSHEAKHILSLLGHRQYCLKACSEVSPRTKLCELHMPEILQSENLNPHNPPQAIMLFETLMSEPVIIHNMDKRQRVLLKRLEDSESASITASRKRKRKNVTWTKDLPPLEHVFAEGVEFSLTDICVFPCVDFFVRKVMEVEPLLVKNFPKICKWYRRLMDIEQFVHSVEKCGLKFLEGLPMFEKTSIECNAEDATQVLLLGHSSNTDTSQTEKKDIALTIRRDLPDLLRKLNTKGLLADFSEFDHKEIVLQWERLPKEVHPVQGELNTLRASRKCHQIENLAYAVRKIAKDGDTIVDFCSGGGHVGIVLSYLLPNCSIVLVENKEESLGRARARIRSLKMTNVTVYQCNLEYFSGNFQIGVALHACGVASDMVVQSCIAKKASFVVSPCCYGKVRNCHWISYPQSKLYKDLPLSFEESLLLGHAADKTSWDFENKHAIEGKHCMGLMDMDRANAAREHGYDVTLYTMQPPACSPKNNMLFGISPCINLEKKTSG